MKFSRSSVAAVAVASALFATATPAFALTDEEKVALYDQTDHATTAESMVIKELILNQGADEHEVNLNWFSKSGKDEKVEFTKASGGSAGAVDQIQSQPAFKDEPYTVHRTTVRDLQPNTEYRYRVGSDEGGWSKSYTFKTGDGDGKWDFTFFGDPQVGASGNAENDGQEWRKTADHVMQQNPDNEMMLISGDQVNLNDQGNGTDWTREYPEFFSPDQLRRAPIAVDNGNHDDRAPERFDDHYYQPNRNSNRESRDFAFRRNNAVFVVLDTNGVTATGAGDQDAQIQNMQNFTRGALGKLKKEGDWVIVSFHHSMFSQAGHRIDGNVKKLRYTMSPFFSEQGVDLVLAGHDHNYSRSKLINGNQASDVDQAAQVVEPEAEPAFGDVLKPKQGEVLHVTANSSTGSKYYAELPPKQVYTAVTNQDNTPDYAQVSVSPTELTVHTRNVADDSDVDKVTITRDAPATPEKPGQPGGSLTPGSSENSAGSLKPMSSLGSATGSLGSLFRDPFKPTR